MFLLVCAGEERNEKRVRRYFRQKGVRFGTGERVLVAVVVITKRRFDNSPLNAIHIFGRVAAISV